MTSMNLNNEANSSLAKFKKMLTPGKQADFEDDIMHQLQHDYLQSLEGDFGLEQIEQKLKFYEENVKVSFGDQNLKAVINNNIISLRGQHKHELFGDSIKLIDESINGNMKQTEE